MNPLRWRIAAAVAVLVAFAGLSGAEESQHAYVGVAKCKRCHGKELYGNQESTWRAGPHAAAYESLASEKSIEYARAQGIEGSPQQADECLECHVTAHGVDSRRFKFELDPSDGIQCESCHGAGADFRKRSIMSDREKSVPKGLVPEPDEESCRTCHNDRSPAWDPNRYTLADGSAAGFDFEQAKGKILHPIPEERRGKIAEIERELKEQGKRAK